MDELYLENIDEYVTDQNKIVTYKWLSLTLGVHVNQAKQMLFDYVERKRKENSGAQLHVTYLVTGKHIQNGYAFHKVAVVKEEKLEAVKSKLAVVSSVHVYSIQKAVLKDSGPLFSTDYDIIKANLEICSKFSAIQCSFAVRRALSERSSKDVSEQQTTSVPLTNGHGPTPSTKAPSQPPKGIMGMFAGKAATKSQNASKESKPEVKEPPASAASSKSTAKSNAMNNFFGKVSMKKKSSLELEQNVKEEKSSTEPVSSEPEVLVNMSSTVEKPVQKSEEEPMEIPVSKPSSVTAPADKKKKGKKSKAKSEVVSDSDDEKSATKKRRRIKKPVSDSSEDEEASVSPPAIEEQPPSPLPPPEQALKLEPESQPIAAQTSGKKRKRRRVIKSKTFVDEEGCIVTEKRYESESCTDSESEAAKPKLPVAPKPQTSAAAKHDHKPSKKAPAAAASRGVKQSSIMGFFQKK